MTHNMTRFLSARADGLDAPKPVVAYLSRPSVAFFTQDLAQLGIPDPARAFHQYDTLCDTLANCGLRVENIGTAATAALLSGHTAVIADDIAVISQTSQPWIVAALASERFLKFIEAPGALDAADVARAGDHFFIGLSDKTNQEGAAQLAFHLTEFGYAAHVIDMALYNNLRLGACVSDLGLDGDMRHILLQEELALHFAFTGFKKTLIPAAEYGAASPLRIGKTMIVPQRFTQTSALLAQAGFLVRGVNLSEFDKTGIHLAQMVLILPPRAIDSDSAKAGTQTQPADADNAQRRA